MGLAASQAKLLSITTRLSDNELRSQTVTAAKLALASQSSEASRKYINALNTNEFIYRTYDEMGNKVYRALTGSILTTYGPLKNQYALINTAGQILISELDAANYESSKDINEFLSKYGIDAIPTGKTRKVTNPAYAEAYQEWESAYVDWVGRRPDQYITTLVKEAWTETVKEPSTEKVDITGWWPEIMETGCISGAIAGTNCWMHVVASLLGAGVHYTSDGKEVRIYGEYEACDHGSQEDFLKNGSSSYAYWCWNTDRHPQSSELKAKLHDEHVCGHIHDEYADLPYYNGTLHVYCKDPTCEGSTKSVYEKLVDLLYESQNDYLINDAYGGTANPDHAARFWHIIAFDLCKWEEVQVPGEYIDHPAEYKTEENPEYQEWLDEEPKMEDIPEIIDEQIYEYSDKDKAQWYVNLWHRINGPSQEKDGTEELTTTSVEADESGNYTSNKITTTTTTRNRYDILEDGLMNSQDWLKYALETGAVSLERVNFAEQTEDNTGLKKAEWTSIIYNNALDISEQTNERKIAQAEAEYEQKQREIENKDKQYDSMLKLLDTEHNALQTEYDSIKSVIAKNTERTLKIYSA